MTKLDELERLLAKATPGPWRADVTPPGPCGQMCRNEAVVRDVDEVPGVEHIAYRGMQRGGRWFNDANLIAAFRNIAPKLIAVARKAEALSQAHFREDQAISGPSIGQARDDLDVALAALEEP